MALRVPESRRSRTSSASRGSKSASCGSLGIDDFNAKLPGAWFDVGGEPGRFSADGVRFGASPERLLVAIGEVGRRLLAAYRRTVAAFARAGLNVIVDEVTFDEAAACDSEDALGDLPRLWVALHCDAEMVEARERARGDRALGLARELGAIVHNYRDADLELDTTTATVEELTDELVAFVMR